MTAVHTAPEAPPVLPFTPRLPPLAHQAAFLREHAYDPAYGLLWEQGTGKTKALIDNAVMLAMDGLIDGVFLLAPNGVHYNWFQEELPKHWPADAPPYQGFMWDTAKAANKAFGQAWETFQHTPHLPWLCMSYDGVVTDAGKRASWHFMRQRRVLYIADESQRIKTPQTRGKNRVERTAVVRQSGQYARYRRIASGTPMDTPLDIYSQVMFLDPGFWERTLGIGNYAAFKAFFAQWRTVHTAAGHSFPQLVRYQRLDELEGVLRQVSQRVTKEQVLDLPPKSWKRHFHELSREQATAYRELRQEMMTWLQNGELITAEMALVRQLRLAQVSSGFLSPTGGRPVPFRTNPRAELLRELLRDVITGPVVAWGQFTFCVETLAEVGQRVGRRVAVFDGTRPGDALEPWHAGRADLLVANLGAGLTEGHTLTEAQDMVYYSNGPKLITRQQSEDRIHRIGTRDRATYHDLLATGTQDAKNLDALRAKRDAVGLALGDPPEAARAWLLEYLEEELPQ